MHRSSYSIGVSTALFATQIPDWLLSYGGKLLFAVLTAAAASFVSNLVSRAMSAKGSK